VIALPTWHIALAHAATLAALLWATGGVGVLVVGASCAKWRGLAAQMLIGFLGYTVLLAVTAEVGLDFGVGVVLVCAYLVLGLGILVWHYHRDSNDLRKRLLLAVTVAASSLSTSLIPGNTGALDPLTYAYASTVMFHADWVAARLTHLSTYAWLQATLEFLTASRLGSLSTLWPVSALGLGLDMSIVSATECGCLGCVWC